MTEFHFGDIVTETRNDGQAPRKWLVLGWRDANTLNLLFLLNSRGELMGATVGWSHTAATEKLHVERTMLPVGMPQP